MERQRQKDRKERRLIGIVHVFSGGKRTSIKGKVG